MDMNELFNKLGYHDYLMYEAANCIISIGLSGNQTMRAIWSYRIFYE